MHTGEHHFLRACVQGGLHIVQHVLHRTAAPSAACHGGDAEGAFVVTAVLHLDEGARAQPSAGNRLPFDWL